MNRTRVGRRQRGELSNGKLNLVAKRPRRQRKSWIFEKLEERYYFSATPLNFPIQSFSSLTPEGAAQIYANELYWAALQQAGGSSSLASGSSAATGGNFSLYAVPDDPLFPHQWYLFNTGQQVGNPNFQDILAVPGEDINVLPVWEMGYTGQGVRVAVIDSGTELTHPDLIANIHPTLRFDAITGDNNPSPDLIDPINAHGTAVAGIIGAAANGIGGVGVAPGVSLVPIRLIDVGATEQSSINAFNYATENVDITNNSWGPALVRQAAGPTPGEISALRNSVIVGRGGLGVVHVFASGNSAGPDFVDGWLSPGLWDSSSYDGYVNSRYVIGVSGIDHDGLYSNIDGTVTHYPEIGPSVLVAAPTASFAAISIGDDFGIGSGIYTTDLTGDNGFNVGPLFGGQELDFDYLADTDYTSRFNGTSAAAPMVSGVIALMLEANPNLTYRDVQEILVRSSRQAGQFETPQTGGGLSGTNSWQTNQLSIFRDPDLYLPPIPADPGDPNAMPPIPPTPAFMQDPFLAQFYPLTLGNGIPEMPASYTNGAGYTVSEGFGPYGDRFGYGHGVVDAELAVKMAEQWHDKNQNLPAELTFTTSVALEGVDIPAAEVGNMDTGRLIVPGAWGGEGGFIDYWEEYYADDDEDDPDDGPFTGMNPPTNTRGIPYIEWTVPPDNTMSVEWAEVKINIGGGDAEDSADHLRLLLVSPEGTYSEMNPFYGDPGLLPASIQNTGSWSFIDTGPIDPDGGEFIWTFSTNRSWGERSDGAIQYDPVTGDPFALSPGWKLYVENWSGDDLVVVGLELIWHGSRIDPESKRVQGFVGIDENQDQFFNYSRVIRGETTVDLDLEPNRFTEFFHLLDLEQETFASNVTLQAKRVSDGVVVAEFLTGADGNYYFDLIPDDYVISITEIDGVAIDELVGTTLIDDMSTPAGYLQSFKQEWTINEDWFYAWESDQVGVPGFEENLVPIDVDGVPLPYAGFAMPANVRGINFLLDVGPPPAEEVYFTGTVFADINGDGQFNGDDVSTPDILVYADTNKSGAFEGTDLITFTDANGNYQLTVPVVGADTIRIGVLPPDTNWTITSPEDGAYVLVGFSGDSFTGVDFAIQPTAGTGTPTGALAGSILGVVFQDQNGNGIRESFEQGVSGQRVFIDLDADGEWDNGVERSAITNANGAYLFTSVAAGSARLDIVIPDVQTWSLTTPAAGFQTVTVLSDRAVSNVLFGLENNATSDWGDLAGYPTLPGENGASHFISAGFRLGASVDGEVVVNPTANADGDDLSGMDDENGVQILSNGGLLQPGANTLRVTLDGVGGYLNAWIDWNSDGDWTDAGEQVFVNRDLNPGTHDLLVTAPANMAGGALAARFRWGSANLSFVGADVIGEVEDYRLANSLQPVIINPAGDFNSSGLVDREDYLLWKDTYGSTSDLRADGNNDGIVNSADYTVWRNNTGAVATMGAGAALGSGSSVTQNPRNADLAYSRSAARQRAIFDLAKSLTTQVELSPEIAAIVQSMRATPATIEIGGQLRTVSRLSGAGVAGGSGLASGASASQSFDLTGLQFSTIADSPSSTSVYSASVDSTVATNSLALLDDAWAIGDDDDDFDPDSLSLATGGEENDATDLAMAALFTDEDPLSSGI